VSDFSRLFSFLTTKNAMVMGGKNKKPSSSYAYQNANSQHAADSVMADDDKECQCCSLSCLKFSLHLFNAVFFLTGFELFDVAQQGGQIGRIFAYRVIGFFEQLFENYSSSPKFCVAFFHCKICALILAQLFKQKLT
jgi:hypothetical protein